MVRNTCSAESIQNVSPGLPAEKAMPDCHWRSPTERAFAPVAGERGQSCLAYVRESRPAKWVVEKPASVIFTHHSAFKGKIEQASLLRRRRLNQSNTVLLLGSRIARQQIGYKCGSA